jgi:competence protein ComEC
MTLAWFAAAWIGGTTAAALLGRGAWPLALALLAAMLAYAVLRRDTRVAAFALVLPALFAGAVLWYEHERPRLAADAAAHYNDGVHMRVSGVVRADPVIGNTSQRFTVDIREIQIGGEWQPASGGVQVRVPLLPRYLSGDVVELEGALETPPQLDGFNYADYLARQRVASVMQYPRARKTGHERPNLFWRAVLHTRRELSRGIEMTLPEPQASLAQGVLLGKRSALPPDVIDDLNITNTSHLVVVSGGNVILVAAFVTLFTSWALGRRRAMVLSVAAILCYATLVGAADPPVMRATIMGVLMVIAGLFGRHSNGFVAVLVAASLMIAHEPHVVHDVSFQLSFAATTGIIYLGRPLRACVIEVLARALRRDELPRAAAPLFAEPLAITLAAIIATTPLLALNFERFSLVGVPVNLVIVPLFPLMLGASALAAAAGMLPEFRLVFAAPAYVLLTLWLDLARWFASLPFAAATLGGYTTPWAVATYGLMLAAAAAFLRWLRAPSEPRLAESRPLNLARMRGVVLIAAPALLLAGSIGAVAWPSGSPRLEVTVIDVGQGDAILVRGPDGQHLLVDGGPGRAVLRGLGAGMAWHDRTIDMIVLTHPDADHLVGLLDVLERYSVRRVLAGEPPDTETLGYRMWVEAVADEGVPIESARTGTVYDLGQGATLEVLWTGVDGGPSRNDESIVLRVEWGDVSFLLTGDIEADAERALVTRGAALESTVLKVPHHGSRTSTTRAFLEAVQPDVAVISAGPENVFGHPAEEVVTRLEDYAIVYLTAEHGSVRLSTDGERLWIATR